MSACRELSFCRLTRGSKNTSVKGDDLPEAGTAVEKIDARRGENALVKIRPAAVMSDVVATDVEEEPTGPWPV